MRGGGAGTGTGARGGGGARGGAWGGVLASAAKPVVAGPSQKETDVIDLTKCDSDTDAGDIFADPRRQGDSQEIFAPAWKQRQRTL